MFSTLKKALERLKNHEPGERFGAFHREQKDRPVWVKVAFFAAAFVSLGVGVVLAFIPGPAVLFFALGGALLSTQSRFVAETLDKLEVWARRQIASFKAWRRRRQERRAGGRKAGHARG
jgi:hypothetical protein